MRGGYFCLEERQAVKQTKRDVVLAASKSRVRKEGFYLTLSVNIR